MALVEGMCTNFNMFFKFTKAILIKKTAVNFVRGLYIEKNKPPTENYACQRVENYFRKEELVK